MKYIYKTILHYVKKQINEIGKTKGIMAGAILILIVAGIVSTPRILSVTTNGNVSKRELPIYCVETQKPQVALSFDAAWGEYLVLEEN